MNFFERQHEVRKVSGRLVWLFLFAVIGIVAVVDIAVLLAFQLHRRPVSSIVLILGIVSAAAVALIAAASLIRMWILRRGGGAKVATQLGGVYIPEDTTDPDLRRLRNVVEEIAIASGTPVPELYLLPQETGINAFAAGWAPADAAVAVTQGALARLNRDELQGVIAHEFSHVVNGDMRLNIRLMGVLFGILGLAVLGRILLSGGGRGGRRNNAGPLIIVALAVMLAGYIGIFAGRLIKAAVSRQREYLADASAVQFTRQSAGIAGALKKIGGLTEGSTLRSGKVDDVSHMLFGEGRKFASMFATHPPLPKRIQQLDPGFHPEELEQLSRKWAEQPPSGRQEDQALGLASGARGGEPTPAQPAPPPPQPSPEAGAPPAGSAADPGAIVDRVGAPTGVAQQYAQQVLRGIPERLQEQARRPDTVVPLVFGLLMSGNEQARGQQYRALANRYGQPMADAAWHEGAGLARIDPALRLPLAELAFPALRRRSQSEISALMDSISMLVNADGRTSVFEYCLSTLLRRDLYESARRTSGGNRRRLENAQQEVATLLAVLARTGHRDPASADSAYRAGMAYVLPRRDLPFSPPGQGPVALDSAWPALDRLDSRHKELLVQGMVTVVGYDGAFTVHETELVRTVCAMLHCPVPPLAATGGQAPAGQHQSR